MISCDHETRKVINQLYLEKGVVILDIDTTYIESGIEIGKGTIIYPNNIIEGNTVIGENCVLGPNNHIKDCKIGDKNSITNSVLTESVVGSGSFIGPFAYLRPNCVIGDNVKVGDFVEIKNSNIGDKTKISHLTYVGDSDVGENVNFGCGTVTVNYNGKEKNRTVIEDNAFIGCNTNLVAPVTVGKGAYTAAGTTVTKDVPTDALVIGRVKQEVKENWAKGKTKNN